MKHNTCTGYFGPPRDGIKARIERAGRAREKSGAKYWGDMNAAERAEHMQKTRAYLQTLRNK